MPASPDRDVIRVHQLEDLVASVPYSLGFRPVESLVVTALTGRRGQLSFTMRVDLAGPGDEAVLAAECARRMSAAKADSVIAFVFSAAEPVDLRLPHAGLVRELKRELRMPLREALLVGDGRLWSYTCTDPVCCPPEGRRFDSSSPGATSIAAAHALRGHTVLPSRDDLVATVRPVAGIAADSMDQALERAAAEYLRLGSAEFTDGARTLLDALVERWADPRAVLTHDEAATVGMALHDIVLRDEVLYDAGRDDEVWRRLLGALARLVQPPLDAPTCTLLAWVAYLQGDGVVAMTALERALTSDPEYTMAGLLASALNGQLPPSELRRLIA
ncbi:MAG: DUF4192 domain-containing protein [Frankiales bacterium]|nr:DUF4192 domain-containing protein [Frankiales bacterium]